MNLKISTILFGILTFFLGAAIVFASVFVATASVFYASWFQWTWFFFIPLLVPQYAIIIQSMFFSIGIYGIGIIDFTIGTMIGYGFWAMMIGTIVWIVVAVAFLACIWFKPNRWVFAAFMIVNGLNLIWAIIGLATLFHFYDLKESRQKRR